MTPEASRHKEPLGQRERELLDVVHKYEQPLLKGLWKRWGDQTFESGLKRGWLVCGPGRIALSRIINWKTNIPILKDGNPNTQEHLRLSQSYFHSPPDNKVEDMADHEFISYYNGKGWVTHIDVTWNLLWGDKKNLTGNDDLQGAILMQKFPVSEYDKVLREKYHLVPFDPENNDVIKAFLARFGWTPSNQRIIDEYYSAYYSDQFTSERPLRIEPLPGEDPKRFEDPYERSGTHLANFIRTIIPEWTGIKK